ncbi:DUF4845 domain-containing protein [Kangiella marina]|uniref:DUF4845 domain-containing protein n=1 Tax=Kangiella marina TaxID=1079178 RepID=A0ABP8IN26_9GAMM
MFGRQQAKRNIMNRQYQNGMTAAGWLIIMAIVLFFMYLAIKLIPAYMEFFSIKSSLESVAEETNSNSSKSDLQRLISGRFSVNNIDIIKTDDVEIKDITGGKALYVEYENRISLFGNVSALVEFKHEEPLN